MKTEIIDFDLEMAKEITEGDLQGRIVCMSEGDIYPARIVDFNYKGIDNAKLIAVIDYGINEYAKFFNLDGTYAPGTVRKCTLKLEVPDIYTFKKGDILIYYDTVFIFKGYDKESDLVNTIALLNSNGCVNLNWSKWFDISAKIEKADQVQIDRLMSALHKKGYKWDAEKLELVKLNEFKPFDKVLIHTSDGWKPKFFGYTRQEFYITVDGWIVDDTKILPYEGNEHLLNRN